MSAISVDPVDANWRLFQSLEEPLTRRGRSRLCGHRRTRGHDELEKHDGSLKHSGRRFVALARVTMSDLTDGLTEFFETKVEEDEPSSPQVVGYSENPQEWERRRRRADRREIKARHKIILQEIEDELRLTARLLKVEGFHEKFLSDIAWLESELAVATSIGEIETLKDRLAAAELDLELMLIDLDVLAPYASAA